MAIGFRATGAWIDSNGTTLNPAIPAGAVAGDLMVMFFGSKPFNNAPTINQSWNDATSSLATDGSIAAGTDTGSMQARIFWKIHTGTETNPTVTSSGTINVASAVIVVFSKDVTATWDLAFGGGGDPVFDTAFSTTTAVIPLAPNDWVASMITTRTDAASIGTFTTTATGITFGAFNSQPTAGYTTTTGGDMSARSGYNAVSTGTATAAITVAATLGGNGTGSMSLVRMRELFPSTSFDPMGQMGFFGL